jgi:hypothetical protein
MIVSLLLLLLLLKLYKLLCSIFAHAHVVIAFWNLKLASKYIRSEVNFLFMKSYNKY